MSILQIPTAKIFEPLLGPSRYKGLWGGRSGAKSHFFADNGIERAMRHPGDHGEGLRMVCIREVQKTLEQSAMSLIKSKLRAHGLGEAQGFRVFKNVIETPGDGIVLFQGMQDHTAESIKSLDDMHVAWCEEAQTMSAHSLKILRPTIRAESPTYESELWFSWNPTRKMDPVDVLLRQGTPPTNSIVLKAGWDTNPWFPRVMEQERLDCLRDEPEEYEHIWEGDYVGISKSAYWSKQLIQAKADGRLTGHVAPDPLVPVRLFCDLGGTGRSSDAFVIWAAQFIGKEIRVLDYYEAQGQDLATHLAWLREQGYTPESGALVILPHDGETHDRVHDVSFESAFTAAGYDVTVVPNQGKGAAKARIEEARRLFPAMWFDEKRTAGGVEALSWYHEKIDEKRGIGLGPDHDWSSHASDAFGLMCVAHETPAVRGKPISFTGWGG